MAVSLPPTDADDPEQLASFFSGVVADGRAAGQRVLSLHPAAGLHLRVLPDRGLDIGAAWFNGSPVAWRSAVGETAPADSWDAGWGGGLLTTCGLRNVGTPSQGQPQHGTMTRLPATDVRVHREVSLGGPVELTVSGSVLDAPESGPLLRLDRRITVRSDTAVVDVVDVTTNLGETPEQTPILYHLNLGAPFLRPSTHLQGRIQWTRPRDPASAELGDRWAVMGPAVDGERDDVFEHGVEPDQDGWAQLLVVSQDAGALARVEWDTSTLPRLHTWRRATRGSYVLAVEPANCSVLGRAADLADGTAPLLRPGAERVTRVRITFEALQH